MTTTSSTRCNGTNFDCLIQKINKKSGRNGYFRRRIWSGPILASSDMREHKSDAKIGLGRRLWGNRHSGVEKHSVTVYKKNFKDTN